MKPVLGSQRQPGHPLAQGLVGCWPMNEGYGNTKIYDLSGNGRTGTFGATTKSPTWVAGKFGYCLSFDGGDYVNLTGLSAVVGTFTVSLWFNSTSTTNNTMLLDCSAGRFILYWRQSDELALYDGDGNYRWFGTPPSDGLWHNLVFVANAATLLCNCYIDGVQKGITRPYVSATIGGTIGLGSRYDGTDYYFTGLMDNLQIWNRAFFPAEIAQLYYESFVLFQQEPIELYIATSPIIVPPSGAGIMTLNTGYWGGV